MIQKHLRDSKHKISDSDSGEKFKKYRLLLEDRMMKKHKSNSNSKLNWDHSPSGTSNKRNDYPSSCQSNKNSAEKNEEHQKDSINKPCNDKNQPMCNFNQTSFSKINHINFKNEHSNFLPSGSKTKINSAAIKNNINDTTQIIQENKIEEVEMEDGSSTTNKIENGVFISLLPKDITLEKLEVIFGRTRGFVEIRKFLFDSSIILLLFNDAVSVDKAIHCFKDYMIDGNTIKVSKTSNFNLSIDDFEMSKESKNFIDKRFIMEAINSCSTIHETEEKIKKLFEVKLVRTYLKFFSKLQAKFLIKFLLIE